MCFGGRAPRFSVAFQQYRSKQNQSSQSLGRENRTHSVDQAGIKGVLLPHGHGGEGMRD